MKNMRGYFNRIKNIWRAFESKKALNIVWTEANKPFVSAIVGGTLTAGITYLATKGHAEARIIELENKLEKAEETLKESEKELRSFNKHVEAILDSKIAL